jgi:hypothetical protein
MVRDGNVLSREQLAHEALVPGSSDGGNRVVRQVNRLCNGGCGDGCDIVHSDHRINGVLSSECNREWKGSLRISNIEWQEFTR